MRDNTCNAIKDDNRLKSSWSIERNITDTVDEIPTTVCTPL